MLHPREPSIHPQVSLPTMSGAASEEILEIDLEEIRNSQPAPIMSEKTLREEVVELQARIRQDFPDDSEFGFEENENHKRNENENDEGQEHVQEPDDTIRQVSLEPQLNEGVKLESLCGDQSVEAEDPVLDDTIEAILEPTLPESPGSLLEVSEVDGPVSGGEDGDEGDAKDQYDEGDAEDLGDESGDANDATAEELEADWDTHTTTTTHTHTDPNTIMSCFSVPVKVYSGDIQPDGSGTLLYGKGGIVAQPPDKDASLEQIFEILRNYCPSLPAEQELYLYMPQLDLRLGEDNIYCKDTTLVDLIRLLDTCDEYPECLRVEVECQDRFISKLNALFDVLNDQPPAKRHRSSED